MKSATGAAITLLSTGQYVKAELFDIVLADSTAYHFTSFDRDLKISSITYQQGLAIKRGTVTSKAGVDAQSLDLTIVPLVDNVGGVVTIGGYNFWTAARLGVLDGARVTMWKIFMAAQSNPENYDTTIGKIHWFQGRVNEIASGRHTVDITVNSDIEILNVSMPRNVIQTGCVHTLFDAGCTLNKVTYTTSSSVSGTGTQTAFNSGLTQADGYFDQGIIKFTSGANSGISRVVKSFLHASGAITLVAPLPNTAANTDAFTITPGCDKKQATCSSKFSNQIHFRGYPYVPVPETLYDGGTSAPPTNTPGWQVGSGLIGSTVGAAIKDTGYTP